MTIAKKLEECCQSFEKLFQIFSTKHEWHLAYPQLVNSATQIETFFHQHQHVAIADLAIYDVNFDYATNLLKRQCLIICILTRISGLNRIATVKLLQNAISQLVSVREELNTVGARKTLTVQQRKTYQARFRQSYAFLKSHMAQLPLVQTELVNIIKKRPVYSQLSAIVRLSFALAKQSTNSDSTRIHSLKHSIGKVYFKITNTYEKELLKILASIFEQPIPGENIHFEGAEYLVLGSVSEKKLLCYHVNNDTFIEVRNTVKTSKSPKNNFAKSSDYYQLWEKLPQLLAAIRPPFIDEYFSRQDLITIKKAAYFSMGKLISELNKNPNAQMLIFDLSERFSSSKITDVRHAIALVGVEQLPDLLENQQLLQRLYAIGKLNWQSVATRIKLLITFIESYKSVDPHFPCQKIINSALKYIAFLFKVYPHGALLPINNTLPKLSVNLLTTTVNFYCVHKITLPEQIQSNPFYEISQPKFDLTLATSIHSACYLHLVLLNCVFLGKPLDTLTAFEKHQLTFAKKQLAIEDLDKYLDKLLDFSPANPLL
ncbi:hypothetical protein [Pseudoalteromonas sp. G4]|uniref:hypothetical protein n=1 Tax=Pseudoalteromonas sp. G4 TaxID=2992761 RepID=UPI00237DF1F8|nr:hypothetical protein [Pseudoalteromonas sp. G4]MDE3271012.1 hypothetical protein [Pseudoalteromonas sp. G4]